MKKQKACHKYGRHHDVIASFFPSQLRERRLPAEGRQQSLYLIKTIFFRSVTLSEVEGSPAVSS
jgi:hypothetical protein